MLLPGMAITGGLVEGANCSFIRTVASVVAPSSTVNGALVARSLSAVQVANSW